MFYYYFLHDPTDSVSLSPYKKFEHLVVNEIGHVVRVGTTRTVLQTSSSPMQLLRISSPMVTTWKSKKDGLRRQDAERAGQHTDTSTWYDVKHVDAIIV